jgi:gluconolactonase
VEVISTGFGLPEGPVFDPASGELYISDASAGGVWRVPTDGGPREEVVPHRRGIGGVASHADGGLVVSGRNVAWKRAAETWVLAEVDLQGPRARFNDLTTSPGGRVYAGSIDYEPGAETSAQLGSLVMIDLDGATTPVAGGLAQTNGLAFSADGRRLFHVDTGVRLLRVYNVAADGSLSDWEPFHTWERGIPDGMAIAEDGSLWIALADVDGTGYLVVLEQDGTERRRIPMPTASVKSLCFGDRDLRTLYVTLGGDALATRMDGYVIRLPSDVAGLPVPPARVRPPTSRA